MTVDDDDRITSFQREAGASGAIPGDPEHVLASMGVYVFSMQAPDRAAAPGSTRGRIRRTISARTSCRSIVREHRVVAYRFGGSERTRHRRPLLARRGNASTRTTKPTWTCCSRCPPIDLYQGDWPIRTYEGQHPPARSVPGRSGREAEIVNCMLASGTLIVGGTLRHTILFPNVRVEAGRGGREFAALRGRHRRGGRATAALHRRQARDDSRRRADRFRSGGGCGTLHRFRERHRRDPEELLLQRRAPDAHLYNV